MNIHGIILKNIGIKYLLNYKIIKQTSLKKFVFEIVTNGILNENHVIRIQKSMNIYLVPGLKIEIKMLKQINRRFSGKIKHFYPELVE